MTGLGPTQPCHSPALTSDPQPLLEHRWPAVGWAVRPGRGSWRSVGEETGGPQTQCPRQSQNSEAEGGRRQQLGPGAGRRAGLQQAAMPGRDAEPGQSEALPGQARRLL